MLTLFQGGGEIHYFVCGGAAISNASGQDRLGFVTGKFLADEYVVIFCAIRSWSWENMAGLDKLNVSHV